MERTAQVGKQITLQPGESKVVRVRFTAREFAYWDTAARAWRTDSHAYTFLIGPASDRIVLEGAVALE